MSIRCLQLLHLTSPPKQNMHGSWPPMQKNENSENALLPLLTCSVKRLMPCATSSLHNFVALCAMLNTTHGINSVEPRFLNSLKN